MPSLLNLIIDSYSGKPEHETRIVEYSRKFDKETIRDLSLTTKVEIGFLVLDTEQSFVYFSGKNSLMNPYKALYILQRDGKVHPQAKIIWEGHTNPQGVDYPSDGDMRSVVPNCVRLVFTPEYVIEYRDTFNGEHWIEVKKYLETQNRVAWKVYTDVNEIPESYYRRYVPVIPIARDYKEIGVRALEAYNFQSFTEWLNTLPHNEMVSLWEEWVYSLPESQKLFQRFAWDSVQVDQIFAGSSSFGEA